MASVADRDWVDDSVSLREARDWLRRRLEDGEHCPCCQQLAKVYRRRIHVGMAVALVRAYREAGRDWFHMPTVAGGKGGGDPAKARYWGLLVEDDRKREDGGRPGYWRFTDLGADFVLQRAKVPTYVLIYDGRRLALEGPDVDIVDCLREQFRYDALMGR